MTALLVTIKLLLVGLGAAWVTMAAHRSAYSVRMRRFCAGMFILAAAGLAWYCVAIVPAGSTLARVAGWALGAAVLFAVVAEWQLSRLPRKADPNAARHEVEPPEDRALTPVDGGATAPEGFRAGGICCGLRSTPDLAIVASDRDCTAAGVFTTNLVKAAPVIVSQRHLADGSARAVVLNAVCANAFTGQRGLRHAEAMATATAHALGVRPEDVLVCSTGVIGAYLDIDTVAGGIKRLAGSLRRDGGRAAAEAIMTTDTVPKEAAVRVATSQGAVTIGGMCKGAGMINPAVATMLAVITTDAAVPVDLLRRFLAEAVADSFNMITVDGDMSTNDTVVCLANGASGVAISPDGPDAQAWAEGLRYVCRALAKKIAADGEGATRRIDVRVTGAATVEDARRAAKAVAGSLLVRTAVYGGDANWGRIVAALGYSGATFDPEKINVWLGDVEVVRSGDPVPFPAESARRVLDRPVVPITADLASGDCSAGAWTCDMTEDYVRINAHYTT